MPVQMRTTVVNVRSQAFDFYVGRVSHCPPGVPPDRGGDGRFGNPVVAGETCPVCGSVHTEPGATIPCFTTYLQARLEQDAVFRTQVEQLKGRLIGCFCAPGPCHADLYVDYLHPPDPRPQADILADMVRRLAATGAEDD